MPRDGWDGKERRAHMVSSDVFNAFVIESEQQRKELRDMVRSVQGTLVEMQRDLKCIHTTWDQHVEEYGTLLKTSKEDAERSAKLKQAVIEKTTTGAVWALLVFLAAAIWSYVTGQNR